MKRKDIRGKNRNQKSSFLIIIIVSGRLSDFLCVCVCVFFDMINIIFMPNMSYNIELKQQFNKLKYVLMAEAKSKSD